MKKRSAGSSRGRRPIWNRAAPRWLRPAARIIALSSVLAIAFGGPAWLWRAGLVAGALRSVQTSALTASADIGLTVQDILLDGRSIIPREQIRATVRLKRGDPILSFDPRAIRKRLEALPWVRSATVERRLPTTVVIRIVERQPMALWQRDGGLTLIDSEGTPITRQNLDRYRHLVIIVGAEAPRHAPALFTLLATQPALNKRVRAAVRVGARRWNLHLHSGIDIRLPAKDAPAAWARLAALHDRHRLLSGGIRMIDLRLPDRLIVRRRPPGPIARTKDGKNT